MHVLQSLDLRDTVSRPNSIYFHLRVQWCRSLAELHEELTFSITDICISHSTDWEKQGNFFDRGLEASRSIAAAERFFSLIISFCSNSTFFPLELWGCDFSYIRSFIDILFIFYPTYLLSWSTILIGHGILWWNTVACPVCIPLSQSSLFIL